MLKQIMEIMNTSGSSMTISELSRMLDTDRDALEGMLDTLVRLGRLVDVPADSLDGCGGCSSCGGCRSCAGAGGGTGIRRIAPRDESRIC